MCIDLSGQWKIWLETEMGLQSGRIQLPGILQAQGYGNPITIQTPWISNLYDAFWFEQEEYKQAQEEECLIPFLAQPPRHFLGKAYYEREFEIKKNNEEESYDEIKGDVTKVGIGKQGDEEWFLRIELARWRSKVWVDDIYMGEDCSLCTAHEIYCGKLTVGKHVLKVCIDNSMQYPYRPDGHGVSDSLGATWNGMVGEIVLETAFEREQRKQQYKKYAGENPRKAEVRRNSKEHGKIDTATYKTWEEKDKLIATFYIDGQPEYFRATHFGGEYPLTGYPVTDKSWWLEKMQIIKEWGLNAIRFHSYCPPEAAFAAADEAGIYLLVECGMWNHFEEDIGMLEVLKVESRRILEQFGHHPSFTFFSPTNEPGGNWYKVLRQWVKEIKEYDVELGYGERRFYTAQSGWFYDVEPAQITGTDFLYFHRSAYGPYHGGTIRNQLGWRGGDYSPSLEGARHPVICHELGQWCAYPDFKVIDKFTGYLKPGNYMVYKKMAQARGLLSINERMVKCSGRNQFRLYKEELEANFRTPEITGFELLDLHDYLGQGTALVGFLDAFWENKGYASPEEFRAFCGEIVLLIRCPSYVWKNTDTARISAEISHFGKKDLQDVMIEWELATEAGQLYARGSWNVSGIKKGGNAIIGTIEIEFSDIKKNTHLILTLSMNAVRNNWDMYVFVENEQGSGCRNEEATEGEEMLLTSNRIACESIYTKNWLEAKEALQQGKSVVYTPRLSDLHFECPCLSIKNVFWNSQMGPTWGRSLGIIVQKEHPIFAAFPTGETGGWQWEDILEKARGMDLRGMEGMDPIVRTIDDWNRSLPLGMMMEAKVGRGKIFLVSADLEGSFQERPAAYCLKQAIIDYVNSKKFEPEKILDVGQIEQLLFPVLRMQGLVEKYSFDANAEVRNAEALMEANPNTSVRIEKAEFPVTINIALKKSIIAQGWIYLPEQRDRAHAGFIRDYRLEYVSDDGRWQLAAEGTFQNTSLSQRIEFSKSIDAKQWRLVILSCYGCVDKEVWREYREGWKKVFWPKSAVVQVAGLHLICTEEAEYSDCIFWEQEQRSKTKEIEN